jgi:CheY-like chemotaxis protein
MQKKRILIVEDNADTVEVYSYALRYLGYDAITARNGSDAVNLARSEVPDVILMDVMLPKIDGFEATSQIRSDPITGSIPIIAVTAMARPRDRDKCLEAGCDEYIAKPFAYKDLANAIKKVLSKPADNAGTIKQSTIIDRAL